MRGPGCDRQGRVDLGTDRPCLSIRRLTTSAVRSMTAGTPTSIHGQDRSAKLVTLAAVTPEVHAASHCRHDSGGSVRTKLFWSLVLWSKGMLSKPSTSPVQ